MKRINIGDKLPDFTLPDQNGNEFNIQQLIGKKNLVIYFYPKDETQGCTMEACSFRDNYETFTENGFEVIGISSDSSRSHQQFIQHHRLPFTLLSDEKKEVRNLFGVPSGLFGLLPGRVTYVVDKKGIVRHIFNSQLQPKKHIAESLAFVKELK